MYDYSQTASSAVVVKTVAYTTAYLSDPTSNYYRLNELSTYADARYGVLFVLGLSSLTVYGLIIAG